VPVITIEGPKIADLAKKRKLVRDLTDAASKAVALPKETMVIILHETSPECVATGGGNSSAIAEERSLHLR